MDFIDYRKSTEKKTLEAENPTERRRRTLSRNYIEEQIREAQERGDFDNLPGFGKPLHLDENTYAGDNALGYSLLKSNGFAPGEIELAKEVRAELERIEAKAAQVIHRGKTLRARRVPPFPGEKRAFNASLEKMVDEYERSLRNLNRKILTLNLSVPPSMHQPLLAVELMVQELKASCPPFEL